MLLIINLLAFTTCIEPGQSEHSYNLKILYTIGRTILTVPKIEGGQVYLRNAAG